MRATEYEVGKVIWIDSAAGLAVDVTMPLPIYVLKDDEQKPEPMEDLLHVSPDEGE